MQVYGGSVCTHAIMLYECLSMYVCTYVCMCVCAFMSVCWECWSSCACMFECTCVYLTCVSSLVALSNIYWHLSNLGPTWLLALMYYAVERTPNLALPKHYICFLLPSAVTEHHRFMQRAVFPSSGRVFAFQDGGFCRYPSTGHRRQTGRPNARPRTGCITRRTYF